MKAIATICARGGSQGVKGKNIGDLCGHPLISYTILQAKKTKIFDVVAVSSDSEQIRDVALQYGADYVVERPLEMATSTAAKLPAIKHLVLEAENHYKKKYDVIVDLDVTSPLRNVNDIVFAFDCYNTHEKATNLVTACPARRSPYFNMLEMNKSGFVQLVKPGGEFARRQDVPCCYDMNASIYIWSRELLFQMSHVIGDHTLLYVMPEERSIDIDSELDFEFVKMLTSKREDLRELFSTLVLS